MQPCRSCWKYIQNHSLKDCLKLKKGEIKRKNDLIVNRVQFKKKRKFQDLQEEINSFLNKYRPEIYPAPISPIGEKPNQENRQFTFKNPQPRAKKTKIYPIDWQRWYGSPSNTKAQIENLT